MPDDLSSFVEVMDAAGDLSDEDFINLVEAEVADRSDRFESDAKARRFAADVRDTLTKLIKPS